MHETATHGSASRAGHSFLCLVIALCVTAAGCEKSAKNSDSSHDKPATVERLPLETELATVTLSVEANERLGIVTRPVQQRSVSRRRTFGGDAMVPTGNSLVVTAPLPGIVTRHSTSSIPVPGAKVTQGEFVLDLIPMLSPERDVMTPAERIQLVGARANLIAAQATAQGDVERSQAEVDAARIALDRAEKLFQDRAGSRKAVDDAVGLFNIAQSNLQAARQREQQLTLMIEKLIPESTPGEATPLALASPIDGIIQRVSVSEGQTVAANAALFEVVDLNTLWIRVPVFVDLLKSIDQDGSARIVSLGGNNHVSSTSGSATDDHAIEASPITAPPTADSLSSSADLYYGVDNRELGLRPGQRVGVELLLTGTRDSLVVPAASVLYDINGGSWVYVVSGERQYTRKRVALRWVDANEAILDSGPAVGTMVVVDGAAELFGTEFGIGK